MHVIEVVFEVFGMVLWLFVHLASCNVLLASWDVLSFVPVQQLDELAAKCLFHFFATDFKKVINNLWNVLMVVHGQIALKQQVKPANVAVRVMHRCKKHRQKFELFCSLFNLLSLSSHYSEPNKVQPLLFR